MSDIDVSRPDLYTYNGMVILNIFPIPRKSVSQYSITYRISEEDGYKVRMVQDWEISHKPEFIPKEGRWYWFSNSGMDSEICIARFHSMNGLTYRIMCPKGGPAHSFTHIRAVPEYIVKEDMEVEY